MRRVLIAMAIVIAGCGYQGRGTAALCEACTQTSDCSEGFLCGPDGQCTTTDCDTIGCPAAVGYVTSCKGGFCACAPTPPDFSATPPDLSATPAEDLSHPADLEPKG